MELLLDIKNLSATLVYKNNKYNYLLNYTFNTYWKYYTFIHITENKHKSKISWKFEFSIWNNKEQFIILTENKYLNPLDVDGVISNKLLQFSYIANPSIGTIQNDTIYMNNIDKLRLSQSNISSFNFKVINSPIKDWIADQNSRLGYYY